MDYIIIGLLVVLILAVMGLTLQLRSLKATSTNREDRSAEELRKMEQQIRQQLAENRREMVEGVQRVNDRVGKGQIDMMRAQAEQSEKMYSHMSNQTKEINETLSKSVKDLQGSNEKKLDEMRAVVDEKLTATLKERLDSSFKQVGDQLQNVYKSMGEMKELAGGVSELQRVLTNVKSRGTWAEVQLGNILEQTLTENQFLRNASIKNNRERVEFAVKIPSRDEDGKYVLLPIDSKFPQDDYVRLQDAADKADRAGVELYGKALEQSIKKFASTIADLYIDVPKTTDFAIMFLPTEGLYAEVLRRPGLSEELQNKYRIMVAGPTTITAFLNTLNVGFKTIALDKKASEVWKILGAAKQQYETFAVALEKAKRKIGEADKALDDATKRNTIIQNKLKTVEVLDDAEANELLGTAGIESYTLEETGDL
ncbi:MAG: DNA recombination protein RmuC [Clostridia bacterium]|nr:DNA recombination protein RmuC [Clostridia bacterium]